MWDFSIRLSLQLLLRTMPFILLRCVVYFGMALAYVLVIGVGAGLGWAIGALGTNDFQTSAMAWGGVGGFALTAAILYLLREYVLYMVKAGHIAVLVELIDGQALPEGQSQVGHATAIVKSRFAQASALFGLDLLVKGVIRSITGLVQGMVSFLPIPGMQQLMGVVRAFLRVAVGLVDEVILAHAIRHKSDNPWQSAQQALVLYGQNARNLLKNAAWLTVFSYGLAVIVFFIMLAPAAGLAWLMPGGWSAAAVVFAVILAWAFKAAVIEPFALACLLQAYFKATDGQAPDPAWEQRLDGASAKFRELKAKAFTWGAGDGGPAAAVPPNGPGPR